MPIPGRPCDAVARSEVTPNTPGVAVSRCFEGLTSLPDRRSRDTIIIIPPRIEAMATSGPDCNPLALNNRPPIAPNLSGSEFGAPWEPNRDRQHGAGKTELRSPGVYFFDFEPEKYKDSERFPAFSIAGACVIVSTSKPILAHRDRQGPP